MGRFIALRELTAGGRRLQPGDVVPEAEKWPHHIQVSEVHAGHVYDLHREISVRERSHVQRETGLLDRLTQFGKRVIESETHPGRHELVSLRDPELDAEGEDLGEPLSTAVLEQIVSPKATFDEAVDQIETFRKEVKKGRKRG